MLLESNKSPGFSDLDSASENQYFSQAQYLKNIKD